MNLRSHRYNKNWLRHFSVLLWLTSLRGSHRECRGLHKVENESWHGVGFREADPEDDVNTLQALTTTTPQEVAMATKTIPKTSDRQTLEIPLEEMQELREIWYGVCAFNQLLEKLPGDEEDHFALRHFHKPLCKRFTDLLAGAPAWDQHMGEVEMEGDKLAQPEAGKPTKYTITKSEYETIHKCYRLAVDMTDMTDGNETFHTVNTLAYSIYEDLFSVLQSAQEVEGGAA